MGVNDARKQVQKQGDELVEFIERQLELRPHTINQVKMDKQMAPDLAPVLPWMTGPPTGWSSQAPAYPPQMMATALDDLQGIIETYEKMSSQANGIKEPAWMRWEQDGNELTELNRHAMGFAAQTVNHTIMPGRRGYASEPPESGSDIERMAWELVEQGRPSGSEETWGMAAQDQVKSFTAVLRLVPTKK
ncbi:hypothetical protein QQZ08_004265 [Neonectria magnoliae]|uniref:Uncharacterized protein n=1 Tax=Neonectria magnoliae TaxID=2732573 RepID=A0ABR1I6U1_9HYPO